MIPEQLYDLSKSVTYVLLHFNSRAFQQHLCIINIVELVSRE